MYVLIRQDLEWPMGALVNQACHACVAVAWDAREDPEAVEYMSQDSGFMTKYTLGAKDEAELTKVADKLTAAGTPFKLWVEQPENIPVCLATWPRRRSEVQKQFKGVKQF